MRLTSIRYLSNDNLSKSKIIKDFFGISKITSKDIAGAFKTKEKLDSDKIQLKYDPLIGPRFRKVNEVNETDRAFGHVRLDCENVPQVHGQFEPSYYKQQPMDTIDIKQKFVPDNRLANGIAELDLQNPASEDLDARVDHPDYNESYLISEVSPTVPLENILEDFRSDISIDKIERYNNKAPLVFYFEYEKPIESSQLVENNVSKGIISSHQTVKLSGKKFSEKDINNAILETSNERDKKPALVYDPEVHEVSEEKLLEPAIEGFEEAPATNGSEDLSFNKDLELKYQFKEEDQKAPLTGFDYLKQVRSGRIEPTAKGLKHRLSKTRPLPMSTSVKLDSKGFQVYTNQVIDWSLVRETDIIDYVKKSIIYNNYDIIAVNKPYGLPSHGKGGVLDMNSIMKKLCEKMKISDVHLVHRLDKTTTGVLLFATSLTRARELHKFFKADQIKKSYWCITKGVPSEPAALIDMPLIEYRVAGRSRMIPIPMNADQNEELSAICREASRAVSEYRVLKSTKEVALVEVKPRSGVKHQIRCHMGFGLDKPILGDHKYSSEKKWAPQRLPLSILKALNLRQQKTRTLPIHLHARTIAIPTAKANGQTLFITAPLPDHFRENLKALKLLDNELKKKIN